MFLNIREFSMGKKNLESLYEPKESIWDIFENGKYFIKPVRIIYKDGTYGGDAFATIDITTNQGNPEFIVTGIKNLGMNTYKDLKEVKEYFRFGEFPQEPKSIKFEFEGEKYTLSRVFKDYEVKYDYGQIYTSKMFVYVIKTSLDKKLVEQEFQYSFGTNNDPLVWIGDLDGDHKLDIVLDYDELAWGEKGLFLSSYAKNGEIVHKVDSSTNWSMN